VRLKSRACYPINLVRSCGSPWKSDRRYGIQSEIRVSCTMAIHSTDNSYFKSVEDINCLSHDTEPNVVQKHRTKHNSTWEIKSKDRRIEGSKDRRIEGSKDRRIEGSKDRRIEGPTVITFLPSFLRCHTPTSSIKSSALDQTNQRFHSFIHTWNPYQQTKWSLVRISRMNDLVKPLISLV
jgi:hypothetical protein